jgi:glycosyltransferase 2 family protein
MTRRQRKLLMDALRIGICAAALWFVARGVTLRDRVTLRNGEVLEGLVVAEGDPLRLELPGGEVRTMAADEIAADSNGDAQVAYGLLSAWWRSNKGLLIVAVLIYFPLVIPLAQRFRILLRVQGIDLSFRESVRLTFAGNFLNFTTPLGSNAGDVFKAYFAALHTKRKTEAVTTVVLDRIIGLGTLVVVAAAITAFAPAGSRLVELRPYMWVLLGAGIIGAALYFSPLAQRLSLPNRFRNMAAVQQLARVDQAVRVLAGHGWTLIASVLLTMALQLLALSSSFVAAIALSMTASMTLVPEFFAYFYAGAIIQALPGPPQGLGTVELAYRHFFAPYGSPSQIICLAFAIRLIALISSLPGLFVALTGSYKPQESFEAFPTPSANPAARREVPSSHDLIGSSKTT